MKRFLYFISGLVALLFTASSLHAQQIEEASPRRHEIGVNLAPLVQGHPQAGLLYRLHLGRWAIRGQADFRYRKHTQDQYQFRGYDFITYIRRRSQVFRKNFSQ